MVAKKSGGGVDDDRAKSLYVEYRSLSEQFKKAQEFLEELAENIAEVTGLIKSLEELRGLEGGSRILAPIANGVFVTARLEETGTVRMNVGGGVVVEKSVPAAQKLLEEQRGELRKNRERVSKEAFAMMLRLKEIESLVEREG